MSLGTVRIGNLMVSKLIVGGNPFSAISHQSPAMDIEMRRYYTTARIQEVFKRAEQIGINTHIGRADHHIMRVLFEYWDEGGAIQWIAQTCPELGTIGHGINNAIKGGAKACYMHGGMMDYLLANSKLDEIPDAFARIKDAGLVAGIAGHNPDVFKWAEEHLDADFYACSYYNAAHRDKQAEQVSGATEWFRPEDRDIMVNLIQKLSKPVIHYKVLAAGRNDPKEAFAFVARYLRQQDAVCVGIFPKHHPKMLEEDVQLLEDSLGALA